MHCVSLALFPTLSYMQGVAQTGINGCGGSIHYNWLKSIISLNIGQSITTVFHQQSEDASGVRLMYKPACVGVCMCINICG